MHTNDPERKFGSIKCAAPNGGKSGHWPFKLGLISKTGPSVGCGANSFPSTVVRGYDLRKPGGHLGNVGLYMVQIRRKTPIHPSRTRTGGAPTSSRMRRLAPAVAAMLAFLTLAACGYGSVDCEQPVLERVLFGGLSLGLSELERAGDCPGADELNDLKIKARKGDPDAQFALGYYYFTRVSPFYPDSELIERSAIELLLCAAEGGSHAAQSRVSPYLLSYYSHYLEEPDASKIIYKYSKISIQREGCDCNARSWLSLLFLSGTKALCQFQLCSSMRHAAEKLSPTQIMEVEDDISVYEPSPKPCDVAILKK